jgi:hypothetical protein
MEPYITIESPTARKVKPNLTGLRMLERIVKPIVVGSLAVKD